MKISYFGEVSAEQPFSVERRRLKTKKHNTSFMNKILRKTSEVSSKKTE